MKFQTNNITSPYQCKESNVIYKVDNDFKIIYVNDAWDLFAKENNGDEIISDKVLGENLFDFIHSRDVKQMYFEIISYVRKGKILKFPFRCDSPTQIRNLHMLVYLDNNGNVTFSSELQSTKIRETPLYVIYTSNVEEEYMLVMCSWCKRVRAENGWVEVEEVLNNEKIFLKHQIPKITHSICEECYATIKAEIMKQ